MSQLSSTDLLETAKTRTGQVQLDLEVASAELGLTHGALQRELPADVKKQRDVAWAIAQNKALERKVQQAAEELEEVTELLEQAQGAA
jgi:dynactin complex subunit